MSRAQSPIVGRWRIIEADLWDRDYLDLCGPATLVIGIDGRGEIAYGAMQAGLDIAYGIGDIEFTWCGFDEMDEVRLRLRQTSGWRLDQRRDRLSRRR